MSHAVTENAAPRKAETWILHCPDPAAWIARIDPHIQVDPTTGCHVWQASRCREGYGRFRARIDGRKRSTGAHRAAWLAHRGDIPIGLMIDHLCRNRACVNPDHMELVTPLVNTRRGHLIGKVGRKRFSPDQLRCGRHDRDDGYLYNRQDGRPAWACRICRRAAVTRYRQRQAQALSRAS